MTLDSTSTEEDQVRISKPGEEQQQQSIDRITAVPGLTESLVNDDTIRENYNNNEISKPSTTAAAACSSTADPNDYSATATKTEPVIDPIENGNDSVPIGGEGNGGGSSSTCYNPVLDDEIRSRLEKLNALSDLINSLERQFDEANSKFRETLKCSTSRLSSIAKTVGTKSIRQSRAYHAAKVSVEQSQSDCQRACVQFEQANKDHQFAKNAIREAESKLKEMQLATDGRKNCVISSNFNAKLNIHDSVEQVEEEKEKEEIREEKIIACDTNNAHLSSPNSSFEKAFNNLEPQDAQVTKQDEEKKVMTSPTTSMINNAAKLSEELNQAITKLIEAERKRGQSERLHLDQANKLMVAQENLLRLEREYGPTIRRTQLYFDETKRFNAKLCSVKGDICRISEDILRAKQAYAKTLKDLERFSDDLHESSSETSGVVN